MSVRAKMMFFALLASVVYITDCNAVRAQNSTTDKQTIAMIKEFYTAYITAFSESPTSANLNKQFALPKKYCTASLLRKINSQEYIEADPFIFAQDTEPLMLKSLSVEKDLRKANSFIVSYRYHTTPGHTDKQVIHLTVIKQGENFKIASIK